MHDHSIARVNRRSFLEGLAGTGLGMLGFNGMVQAEATKQLVRQQKHVVVFWLAGGVSQLETWDPKPGTETGGPFRSIATSVPGVEISELLPHTAQQMHHLAVVRSLNTNENAHDRGSILMQTGQPKDPGFVYPHMGAAFSSLLRSEENKLPGYITMNGGGQASEAAFLGSLHAPVQIDGDRGPSNLQPPEGMTAAKDLRRRQLRDRVSHRFAAARRQTDTEIYDASYEKAAALVDRRDIFDLDQVPGSERERYGDSQFGKHCLMVRRLLEHGVPFARIRHKHYDSHSENFNFHIEQLGEFDRPFATFISDLDERGLLDHTLIVCMAEFGRTPKINPRCGRDHWGTAWSVALGGCGIQRGAVVGSTIANGTEVKDREISSGHLFHTYYRAVGLDPSEEFYHNGRPFHRTDPKAAPIEELLV